MEEGSTRDMVMRYLGGTRDSPSGDQEVRVGGIVQPPLSVKCPSTRPSAGGTFKAEGGWAAPGQGTSHGVCVGWRVGGGSLEGWGEDGREESREVQGWEGREGWEVYKRVVG